MDERPLGGVEPLVTIGKVGRRRCRFEAVSLDVRGSGGWGPRAKVERPLYAFPDTFRVFDTCKPTHEKQRGAHLLDTEQPVQAARYLREKGQGGRILYTLNMLYPFHLTEGRILSAPVMLPAEPEITTLGPELPGYEDIRLVADLNPAFMDWEEFDRPKLVRDGGIVVGSRGPALKLVGDQPLHGSALSIGVMLKGDTSATLRIAPADGNGPSSEHTIAPGEETWVSAGLPEDAISRAWRITFTGVENAGRLMGIRVAPDQTTWWPWDRQVALHLEHRDPALNGRIITFDTKDLPLSAQRPLRVLRDRGITVLAEVLPAPVETTATLSMASPADNPL